MFDSQPPRPAILAFSGLDPSGGAGIQADIETAHGLGVHCCSVITALTAQNTHNVLSFESVDPTLIIEQTRAILDDMPIACFKVGLVVSIEVMQALHTIFQEYHSIPLVIDPIIRAGGGAMLNNQDHIEAMRSLLLPQTSLLIPNTFEAELLTTDSDCSNSQGHELLDMGCENVMITGADHSEKLETENVTNHFFSKQHVHTQFQWPRLPHTYHGSGCTLAAAASCYLASGENALSAVKKAQSFTWHSLNFATQQGSGQRIPHRKQHLMS